MNLNQNKRYYFKQANKPTLFSLLKKTIIKIFFKENLYEERSIKLFGITLPNKITTKLKYFTFNNRSAELIKDSNYYLNFNEKNIYEIEYGNYTSPCIIVKPDEEIIVQIEPGEKNFLLFGIGILDKILDEPENYDITAKINVDNGEAYKFTFPVNRGKILSRSIGSYFRGKEFLDVEVPIDKLKKPGRLKIIFSYLYNGSKIINKKSLPEIAIKSPQLQKREDPSNVKKIIVISCESLTDPFWLQEKYQLDLELKGFNQLISDGLICKNSFSQVDGTLPFIPTIQTGLFPSQHRLGNYSLPIYDLKISENYETLSTILKKNNFITETYTTQGRWDSSFGSSRGFDTFKLTKNAWDNAAPNSGNISRALQKYKNYNSFLFFHIDRVHQPILQFVDSRSPNLYSSQLLTDAENGNWYPALFKELKALDKIIYDIIQTLKYDGVYENTFIILTGDHGISIPPNWKPGLDYALYDEHIRVPSIYKWPSWFKREIGEDLIPFNSTIEIFKKVLESLDISMPEYFNKLPQFDINFKNYAISETIYAPKDNNYSLAMMGESQKYVVSYEVDWKKLHLKSKIDEKLFNISDNGIMYDEEKNLISDLHNRDLVIRDLAKKFINRNLSFSI